MRRWECMADGCGRLFDVQSGKKGARVWRGCPDHGLSQCFLVAAWCSEPGCSWLVGEFRNATLTHSAGFYGVLEQECFSHAKS